MKLAGKVAVIIGGSQGIGESIAKRLASDGANVAVVASANIEKAQAVVANIEAGGGRAFAECADVTDADAVAAMAHRVVDKHRAIDILVNCAGVFFPTPVGGTSTAQVDRMVDINLKGSFYAVCAVAPHMKASGRGKIVSVSSCAGMIGMANYALYCATKSGIIMMTRSLAVELAPHGINVNAIAPGNTATPMNEDIRTKPEFAGFLEAMAARTPSGRTYSAPEDMAGLVAFLVSDEARAMHGTTVLMDEGFTAGI
ncbi:MAG: SDR family oxidoreductase [Burkholderiaceae bacterium]|nr:SDR family oxidoreductase [Burkholderiaceae bacterium]